MDVIIFKYVIYNYCLTNTLLVLIYYVEIIWIQFVFKIFLQNKRTYLSLESLQTTICKLSVCLQIFTF
jgi:hypothetical protein